MDDADALEAKDLGLECKEYTFVASQPTSAVTVSAYVRKTLDQTINFRTTLQCEVSELYESLRDFGGGWFPDSPRASPPPLNDNDDDTVAPQQEQIEQQPDYLGLDVWPAALELCTYLVQYPDIIKNKTVIELGAGVGLPGIIAAKLGAFHSWLTDYEQDVVDYSRKNTSLNGVSSTCSAFLLDWTKLDQLEEQHRKAFDVVLAADVLYIEELMPWFIQAAVALMKEDNGILLVGHQTRRAIVLDPVTNTPELQEKDVAFERFQKLCAEAGLVIRVLGSRESPGFPGPFYMFAACRKECEECLASLPAATWPPSS